MADTNAQARDWLAAEYEALGLPIHARTAREREDWTGLEDIGAALKAIEKVLSTTPQGGWSEGIEAAAKVAEVTDRDRCGLGLNDKIAAAIRALSPPDTERADGEAEIRRLMRAHGITSISLIENVDEHIASLPADGEQGKEGELKPCPFCADPMQDRGGLLQHISQGKCPIGAYAWPIEDARRWNARTSPTVGEDGVERHLRQALDLAHNRLRAAAVNAHASGDKHGLEYSQWADEALTALRSGGSNAG